MLDFLIIVLATWQAVEIWHHSSLFATWRARAECHNWTVLLCPFCLSVWVALVITAWLTVWSILPDEWHLMRLPFIALSASRVANLCNDVFHRFNRTPKSNTDISDPDPPENEESNA